LFDNFENDGLEYEVMPDSVYHLISTSATIKAGESAAALKIAFFPSKIYNKKNYGLPIVITDASGQTISGNYGTLYLHTIGNPIALAYNWDFTRSNNGSGTGSPTGASFTGESSAFIPLTPTEVEVKSGYVEIRYNLSFDDDGNGNLTNFKVKMNAADVKNAAVSIIDGPHIIKADPETGEYIFQFKANIGTADRYLIDRFYK
jgi:BT_3987-like, N-terminal domain